MLSPYLSVLLGSCSTIRASVAHVPQCPCRFITVLGFLCLLLLPVSLFLFGLGQLVVCLALALSHGFSYISCVFPRTDLPSYVA